ncbi:MAG: hypothetical protein ACRESU_03260 [Gammaproteobacteria bacterium]
MKGFLSVVFLGILGLFVAGSASAAVYKCDAHGEIVYSAHPCGKDAVKLKLKDDSYSAPQVKTSTIAEAAPASPSGRTHSSKSSKHACPIDSMESIELRNMRVSGIIMVCETAANVRATWGKPDSIKRAVSKGHVRERWVYDGPRGKPTRSVSLEDGKVTSFQK